MAGLQHHFIHGVLAITDLQYAVTTASNGRVRYNDLHIGQSSIDSACALHCVCMAVMVLCGIARHRIEKISTAQHGPLKDLWELGRAAYFEGADVSDLAGYIAAFAPTLTCDTVTGKSRGRIAASIVKAISGGHVAILGLEARSFSHWVLVTGVEVMPGESVPRALLVLDPSAPRQWGSFYNARLELTASMSGGRFRKPFVLPYRYADGVTHATHLEGLVVVKRVAQPP
jgi:hypothetical protein